MITASGLQLGTAREALAYNLSVQGIHTYHVGDAGFLVHKSCKIIPWSSGGLGCVAGDLKRGATSVTVGTRAQAEELFLRRCQGKGYRNTTGMSGKESREFFGSTSGTYHWGEGDLTPGLPHNYSPHLQIHQPDGVIVRIFFGG